MDIVGPQIWNDHSELALPKEREIMTWAPSHRELALLSDLLHYANMISGFSEPIRRDLRYDLEIMVSEGHNRFSIDHDKFAEFDIRFSSYVGRERSKEGIKETVFCIELSPDYLDYLKDVVKPYL